MAGRERLVPAREVVVARDAIEAELAIDDGQRVLGGVDRTFLQGLEQIAPRNHGHRRAEALEHLAAEAGEADLQALDVAESVIGSRNQPAVSGPMSPHSTGCTPRRS